MRQFRLQTRNYYPWLFAGLASIAVGSLAWITSASKALELSVPAVGVVAGFVYFLYSQHLQETRLFAELFRQFNERYDQLNGRLNEIARYDNDRRILSDDDTHTLYEYFNLCAEEYLYYKAGYIDEEVWNSWVAGMSFFACLDHIRHLWEEEIAGNSYYGFSLALLSADKRGAA
jgi:hypothetical protein